MEAQKQAIDEMIIEGQKETRSNGQKWHRDITNFKIGNGSTKPTGTDNNSNGSTEPQANAELVVEAQKHMQQRKWKNASLLTSNLYTTQSYSTEPSLIEDQIRCQNSSLAMASMTKLLSFKS